MPIIGINTYLDSEKESEDWEPEAVELRRSTDDEKLAQIRSVENFQRAHADESSVALGRYSKCDDGGNIFEELMSTVRVATLGQITEALYAVGGEYRRNL